MLEIHKKELKALKVRMEKCEAFASKVPIFSDFIIEHKLTGEEDWVEYADRFKTMCFAWGLNRGLFKSGSKRAMTNNTNNHAGYFWYLYINTLTLYNDHEKFGLSDICKKTDVFYFDKHNTTFYLTDEQIAPFLECLIEWYTEASSKIQEYKKKKEIDALEDKLAQLKNS